MIPLYLILVWSSGMELRRGGMKRHWDKKHQGHDFPYDIYSKYKNPSQSLSLYSNLIPTVSLGAPGWAYAQRSPWNAEEY